METTGVTDGGLAEQNKAHIFKIKSLSSHTDWQKWKETNSPHEDQRLTKNPA